MGSAASPAWPTFVLARGHPLHRCECVDSPTNTANSPKGWSCRHRSGAHVSRAAVSAWLKSPAAAALLGEPRCVIMSRKHLCLYRFFSARDWGIPFLPNYKNLNNVFISCFLGVAYITQHNFQKAVFYSMPRAQSAPKVPVTICGRSACTGNNGCI